MSQINLTTPPSSTETRSQMTGANVTTAPASVSDTDHEEIIPDEYVNVIVGVFFDGTLNNRKNVEAGIEYKKGVAGDAVKASKYIEPEPDDGNSYTNDYSNISRGEPAYKKISEEKIKQVSIYVEGIGTEDYEDDSTWGKSMGKGATGVKGKVKKSCELIANTIAKIGVDKIDRLQIDSFGFSRGAAAARNFVFEISQKKKDPKETLSMGVYGPSGKKYTEDYGELGEKIAAKGIIVRQKIRSRFVGLYDTVPSFGYVHRNDTAQLNLKAISASASVLQLAADDEHRANFRLTNINSAGGVEKFLPGVHSDIGGGYTDDAKEKEILAYRENNLYEYFAENVEEERDYLIEQGWYTKRELIIREEVTPTFEISLSLQRKVLRANRTIKSKAYSYIPLHIMTKYCINKGVKFDIDLIKENYSIPDNLDSIKKRLDSYVHDNGKKLSYDNAEDREIIKWLRNTYLHFSSNHKEVLKGVAQPMKPERTFWKSTRKRIIQNG